MEQMKGQFYIISAFLIAMMIAAVAAYSYPLYQRTEEKIEKSYIMEDILSELARETVYAARMDPTNTTKLDTWEQYADWYVRGKGITMNMSYSFGPLDGTCNGYYNCDTDCTNMTIHKVILYDSRKYLEKTVNTCWK